MARLDTADRIAQNERPLRMLLTGFGSVEYTGSARTSKNPSWEAIKDLQDATTITPTAFIEEPLRRPIHITCHQVRCTYKDILSTVPPLHGLPQAHCGRDDIEDSPYDVYLHLGQSEGNTYAVEQLAHRFGYKGCLDVDKECPTMDARVALEGLAGSEWDRGDPSGDETVQSLYDTAALAAWLQQKSGLVHVSSQDAGHYPCDFIYCTSALSSLRAAKAHNRNPKPVLFFHVPRIGKPYSLIQTTEVVKLLIYALSQLGFRRTV